MRPIPDNSNVSDVIVWLHQLINEYVIPLLFVLATVAFIWGVIQYYLNPANEEKRKKGKEFIFGGLIALFVMLSVWGIVRILSATFDVDNSIPFELPEAGNSYGG